MKEHVSCRIQVREENLYHIDKIQPLMMRFA